MEYNFSSEYTSIEAWLLHFLWDHILFCIILELSSHYLNCLEVRFPALSPLLQLWQCLERRGGENAKLIVSPAVALKSFELVSEMVAAYLPPVLSLWSSAPVDLTLLFHTACVSKKNKTACDCVHNPLLIFVCLYIPILCSNSLCRLARPLLMPLRGNEKKSEEVRVGSKGSLHQDCCGIYRAEPAKLISLMPDLQPISISQPSLGNIRCILFSALGPCLFFRDGALRTVCTIWHDYIHWKEG